MECVKRKVWTPGLIGDVYHWCDQFEYSQPDGVAYSSGFGCSHKHGYITPHLIVRNFIQEMFCVSLIIADGHGVTDQWFMPNYKLGVLLQM